MTTVASLAASSLIAFHFPAVVAAASVDHGQTAPAASTRAFNSATSTPELQTSILHTAESYEGLHYLWGGTSPRTGFDCSGFIQYIFGVHGIHLPRTASEQASVGTPVSKNNLQPGDLLFFTNTYANHLANQVTHVALYLGHGAVIESSSVGNQGVVVLNDIFANPWYASRYYGARNVLR